MRLNKHPKRLLDISTDSVVLREDVQPQRYVCLSHCWGVGTQIITTTTTNIEDHKSRIAWDKLSPTFQDAITICRNLNINYIWIDSLCIIQDSNDDWEQHAAYMADIYEMAYFTIAATKSKDGSEGCFSKTAPRFMAKLVPGYQDTYVRLNPPSFPKLSHTYHFGYMGMPLLERGWVYQEMRLSLRVLHFCAEEVFWVCRTAQRCEHRGDEKDFLHEDSLLEIVALEYTPKPLLQQPPDLYWYRVVSEYSQLLLTKQSDKLAALAGLAQRMATKRGGSRYLAGLWEDTLVSDLLWTPTEERETPKIPRYPSWSWASISDSPVDWNDIHQYIIRFTQVENISYVPNGPIHLGESSEAAITLRSHLIEAASLRMEPAEKTVKSAKTKTTMDDLYIAAYVPDVYPPGVTEAEFTPDLSGYLIPLATNSEWTSFSIAAIHVKSVPGSAHYERVGHVVLAHTTTDLGYLLSSDDDADCEDVSGCPSACSCDCSDCRDTVGVDADTEITGSKTDIVGAGTKNTSEVSKLSDEIYTVPDESSERSDERSDSDAGSEQSVEGSEELDESTEPYQQGKVNEALVIQMLEGLPVSTITLV